MTITAVPPQRPLTGDETSSEVTSPLLLPTAGAAAAAPAALGPGHRAAPVARSLPRWLVPAVAAVVIAALFCTGVGAYLLGVHSGDRGAVAPASGPVPAAAASAAPVPPVDGPRLVDAGGAPVDAAVAEHVRAVYASLNSADLAAVKRSYSASGSDDWLTVAPKLDRAPIRAALLTAMRTAPAHRGAEYRYRSAGYSLTFQQAGSLPAGLVLINGPWTSSTSDIASTGSSSASSTGTRSQDRSTGSTGSTSAPRRSSTAAGNGGGSCAAGTTATSTQDYPCRDNATGTGVYRDGTAGVHGLKPCPPGTVVPSDPDKPTRNAATGAVCGYVSGSG